MRVPTAEAETGDDEAAGGSGVQVEQAARGMSMRILVTAAVRRSSAFRGGVCVFLLILFFFSWFCFGVLPEVLPFPLRGGG